MCRETTWCVTQWVWRHVLTHSEWGDMCWHTVSAWENECADMLLSLPFADMFLSLLPTAPLPSVWHEAFIWVWHDTCMCVTLNIDISVWCDHVSVWYHVLHVSCHTHINVSCHTHMNASCVCDIMSCSISVCLHLLVWQQVCGQMSVACAVTCV